MITNKIFEEIGGNFWIKPEDSLRLKKESRLQPFVHFEEQKIFTSSGRNAIRLLIKNLCIQNKIVLLPHFTCDSVIRPFFNAGYKLVFYPIKSDMTVDIKKLNEILQSITSGIIFTQPYYGFDTISNLRNLYLILQNKGFTVVEDLTHSWLSDFNKIGADYYVVSLRKWLEIPDGGALISTSHDLSKFIQPTKEAEEIVDLFLKASHQKYQYTQNLDPALKPIFRNLYYKAEELFDKEIDIKTISSHTDHYLSFINFEDIKKKRRENYSFLYLCLLRNGKFKVVSPAITNKQVPLYLAVLSKKRTNLHHYLAQYEVYAPILWPLSNLALTKYANNTLYKSMISIPIDQRYEIHDMERIVKVLNEYMNKYER